MLKCLDTGYFRAPMTRSEPAAGADLVDQQVSAASLSPTDTWL